MPNDPGACTVKLFMVVIDRAVIVVAGGYSTYTLVLNFLARLGENKLFKDSLRLSLK
jgi:hypothetical protein